MKGFFALSTVQQEAPTGLIPKCGACQLFKDCTTPKMKPYGDGAKRVLIVGEAPSDSDDSMGRPFLDKAGQYLRDHLNKLGVRLDRDAISTNALICHPVSGETPESKQISYCHPNLLATMRDYKPRVIIPLGHKALLSVLKGIWKTEVDELERWVGWKIPYEKFWICPTYHPSFLMRMHNQLLERQFSDHLERAFAINEDPPEAVDFEKEIELFYDDKKAADAINEIHNAGGWVTFDYETNCLKPEYPKSRIVSCAISNGRRTISYPWAGKAVGATRDLLESGQTKKIAHNSKMEHRWTLNKLKIPVNNWGWCSMQAAHCLDNRESICSLKFQAFVRMGVETYNKNVEPYLKNDEDSWYNRIHEIELSRLLLYGGTDPLLTHRLAMLQMHDMGIRND